MFREEQLTVGCAAQILFKKRMFRETDETITEPQFVTLSYVQVHALVAPALVLQQRSAFLCGHTVRTCRPRALCAYHG